MRFAFRHYAVRRRIINKKCAWRKNSSNRKYYAQEDLIIMKRTTKRKGFTLVELLIVIVVIGILSAMMMMSSSEAVSSARASTITSNMRNLQTAALAYWADNMNVFNKTGAPEPAFKPNDTLPTGTTKYIVDYLRDDDKSSIDFDDYKVEVPDSGTNQGDWFIQYTFNKGKGDDEKVKQKVAGRAASLGLMKAASTASTDVYLGTGDNLFILVR